MRARVIVGALLLAGCGRIGFDSSGREDCTIALDPPTARVNIDSHVAFAPSEGTAPYTYALTGVGSIDALGRYLSPHTAGAATVTVTDGRGCTAIASLTVGGSELWFIGGALLSDVPTSQVWRSTDGLAWTLAGNLPTARRGSGVVVFDDRIWVIGGENATGELADVLSSADGVTWAAEPALPAGNVYMATIVYAGRLWAIGGYGLPGQVLVTDDGATWTRVGDLPFAAHGGTVIESAGHLWYLGGHNNATGTYTRRPGGPTTA